MNKTINELIEKAQGMVGKTVIHTPYDVTYMAESYGLAINTKESVFLSKGKNNSTLSPSVCEAVERCGFSVFVGLTSGGFLDVESLELENQIELTIKINGKEVPPVEISEETWANLRKQ